MYWTRAAGLSVGGDNATVLAGLNGFSVDRARLATRLLIPVAPWPLSWRPVWERVESVVPHSYLVLDGTDTARTVRYWSSPPQERTRAAAAEQLREALIESVATRVAPGVRVVSHLSGLDSSSVCALAVRQRADVLALTFAQPDAMDDDVAWATRTVAALRDAGSDVTHEAVPAHEVPLVYDGILERHNEFDEPFLLLHNRKRFERILHIGQKHAPVVHLMGLGGDELCSPGTAWLHTLMRKSPLKAMTTLRTVAGTDHRQPYLAMLRDLTGDEPYQDWLIAMSRQLGACTQTRRQPVGTWGPCPTLPDWVTPEAEQLVQAELISAADENDSALAADRGLHEMLETIYTGAATMRAYQRIGAANGAKVAAPFFDDHVMEAALSVRIVDRYEPGRYKPLLVTAMRGLVPDATLRRTTKAETSAAVVLGSRRHRDQIVGIAEGSRLVELGLADAGALTHACRAALDVQGPGQRIETTIGCEMWLRNLEEDTDVHYGA